MRRSVSSPITPLAYNNLAIALEKQGKRAEAVIAYQAAIRINPGQTTAHSNLGIVLESLGKVDEAIAEYRTAIKLDASNFRAHNNLSSALKIQGKPAEAVAEIRKAIELNPDDSFAHYNLGIVLDGQGKTREAIDGYRAAIRIKPDFAEAHCNLGLLLMRRLGEYPKALDLLRRGHELGSKRADWRNPSAEWVRQAEQLVALEAKLPLIVKGGASPTAPAECLVLAHLCMKRNLHGAATRLFTEAFTAEAKLADDLGARNRYLAASAAALAGCGHGKDDAPPEESGLAELRRQARDWLRSDLLLWAKRADSGADGARERVRDVLASWKSDPNLAGIRVPEALATFPMEEQEAWRSLWSDVDALLTTAGADPP